MKSTQDRQLTEDEKKVLSVIMEYPGRTTVDYVEIMHGDLANISRAIAYLVFTRQVDYDFRNGAISARG